MQPFPEQRPQGFPDDDLGDVVLFCKAQQFIGHTVPVDGDGLSPQFLCQLDVFFQQDVFGFTGPNVAGCIHVNGKPLGLGVGGHAAPKPD